MAVCVPAWHNLQPFAQYTVLGPTVHIQVIIGLLDKPTQLTLPQNEVTFLPFALILLVRYPLAEIFSGQCPSRFTV